LQINNQLFEYLAVRKHLKNLASQYFDFRMPISGCSLQVLGSNPCQNALFVIHLELYAVSNQATQGIANPLTVSSITTENRAW
jgi:hypothetical protein